MPHRATITVARPNPILPDQILDTELDEVSRGLGPRGAARVLRGRNLVSAVRGGGNRLRVNEGVVGRGTPGT